MSKVFIGEELQTTSQWADSKSMRHKRRNSDVDAISKEIQKMQHLSFANISSIQFCIDGAIGLPLSSTATRVTARLMAAERSQVGEPSAPSFSNPDSDFCAPNYDLHMGWRGSTLQPSLTIVCRIDTLERPTLQAKCVGFAALKLCVDEHGLQPLPDIEHDHVFLNAGQYLLPIVYGSVPTDCLFSEAIMDKLPHIHSAFLRVRLFDPDVEANPKLSNGISLRGGSVPPSANNSSDSHKETISDATITAVLIGCHPFVNPGIPKLPISELIIGEIQKNQPIDRGEKKVVLRQLAEWIAHAFPNIKQKIGVIDPRYIINYEDRIGTLVALDMLYNLPDRHKLIESAEHMKKSIFKKITWDNHMKYFKTFFRYLPGQNPNRKSTLFSDTDLIVDDASLEMEPGSRELCPVFTDDFSRTAGIELSVHACVLVVVTAVDVLTDSRATTNRPTPYFKPVTKKYSTKSIYQKSHFNENSTDKLSTHFVDPNSGTNPTVEEDELAAMKAKQEKHFKLRGLTGIYSGHEDPHASWWGLVPLMTENPFYNKAAASGGNNNSNSGSGGKGSSGEVNISQSPVNRKGGTTGAAAGAASLYGMLNNSSIYFVDAGTHQVPLFEGLPPQDMLTAANPMAWLQGNLRAQCLEEQAAAAARGVIGACCAPSHHDVLHHKRTHGELVLSPGASAFVSVTDPRLKKFSDEAITKDPNVLIKDDCLRKILKIVSAAPPKKKSTHVDNKVVNVDPVRYNKLFKSFQYIPNNKKIPSRTFEQAIPHNIFWDTLVREINESFINTITADQKP